MGCLSQSGERRQGVLDQSMSRSFLQAQLHSSYLWSLAYRPFGSGAYQEHKSRLLEVMLKTESPATCTLFQSVWQDIRLDLGLAECNTFHTKGTLPKLSRWFSWNDSCEEQLPEFRVLKLCLGYHYQDSKLDPDLAEEQRGLASLVNESKKKVVMPSRFAESFQS